MMPYNVKCDVPKCYGEIRKHIADALHKQGKKAYCWDHKEFDLNKETSEYKSGLAV